MEGAEGRAGQQCRRGQYGGIQRNFQPIEGHGLAGRDLRQRRGAGRRPRALRSRGGRARQSRRLRWRGLRSGGFRCRRIRDRYLRIGSRCSGRIRHHRRWFGNRRDHHAGAQVPVVFRAGADAALEQVVLEGPGGNPATRQAEGLVAARRALVGGDQQDAVPGGQVTLSAEVGDLDERAAGQHTPRHLQAIRSRTIAGEHALQVQAPACAGVVADDAQAVVGTLAAAGQVDQPGVHHTGVLPGGERHDAALAGGHSAGGIDHQLTAAADAVAQLQCVGQGQERAVAQLDRLPVHVTRAGGRAGGVEGQLVHANPAIDGGGQGQHAIVEIA
ncbi:hypothetical protein D3C81_1296250 [compost metagenome]